MKEIPDLIKNHIEFLRALEDKNPEEMITRKECMDIVTSAIAFSMYTMINGDIDIND